MMRPQVGAQKIFRRLGFREESLLPDFVKDIKGDSQDLIVMTCDVKDLWKAARPHLQRIRLAAVPRLAGGKSLTSFLFFL